MTFSLNPKRLKFCASQLLNSSLNFWDVIKKIIFHVSITKKIVFGYAIALNIAVLGTSAGIYIGELYYHQAVDRKENLQEEIFLISRLETILIQVQNQEHLLPNLQKEPHFWEQEHSIFLTYSNEIKQLWSDFKSSAFNSQTSQIYALAAQHNIKQKILYTYEEPLQTYLRLTQESLTQLNQGNEKSEELIAKQQLLFKLHRDSLNIQINHLSHELDKLNSLSYREYEQAEAKILGAKSLRFWIIVFSILLSVTLAAIVSLYTSCVITQPIRTLTTFAQKVCEDTNFNLQAPLTTDDEVGALTVSLNTLIQRVAVYSQELLQKNQQISQTHAELNQKSEELKQTQAQLIQTEKMSNLGQMIASVTHEITNPINFIYNSLECTKDYAEDLLELVQLYQKEYPHPAPAIQKQVESIELDVLIEDLPKTLASMKIGTERLCQLIVALRNFYRRDESEFQLFNIHEGLESCLLILNHQLKRDIDVIKHYGNLPLIECYPVQLTQVFMNILQNAIDALNDVGEDVSKQIVIKTEIVESNCIQIRIQDNGSGISTEVKAKIFEPFFTTKRMGKGTGLGLSIGYKIIQSHHGEITVFSRSNQGTEFAIELPIRQPTSPATVASYQLSLTQPPDDLAKIN